MRDSFIFYASFDEALRELPDKSRLKIYDAISDYALKGIETELSGVEKAVFSLIKPQVDANNARYKNGCLGGRPKANQTVTETKPKQNKTITKTKPNHNLTKTKAKPNDNQMVTKPKPNENENENVNVNDTPLLSPHKGGKGEYQEKFFSAYSQFKKFSGGLYPQIDFGKLIEEFEKSASLRRTFSWQVILDSYESIVQGNFRDKVDGQADGREYMADRERHYTAIRDAEEKKAEKIYKVFMQDVRFAEIDRRLKVLPMEQGKAEANGDLKEAAKLEREKNRLLQERRGILSRNDMTEEDIVAKIHCKKCHDTGYTAEGTLCGCYRGA